MANTVQQRKRVRSAARQRLENLRYKSSIKTLFRRLKTSAASGDTDAAKLVATSLTATIDKAAAHNAIHKNNAARKKSAVSRVINQISAE